MKKIISRPIFLAGFLIISLVLSMPVFALSGAPSKPIAPSPYSGSTTLTFQWDEGTLSDITSRDLFQLQVSTSSSDFANPLSSTVDWYDYGSTWTYSGDGETYYARVRAKGGGANEYSSWSSTSNPVTIDVTGPSGKPGTPTDEGVYSTTTTLVFQWTLGTVSDPESGLSGEYLLQVGTHTDLSQQQDGWKFNGKLSVTSCTVYNCLHSYTYYARVAAYNNAGLLSDFSDQSDGITVDLTAPGTPGQVFPLSHHYSSSTSITFEWNAGSGDPESGIDYYGVQAGTATSEPEIWGVLNTTTSATFTTINNCEQATTYYARVRSKNGAGVYGSWLGPSGDYSITIDTTPPDGAPSKPQGTYYAGLNLIMFSWTIGTAADDVSDIAGYRLEVDSDTSFTEPYSYSVTMDGKDSTTKYVPGLSENITYYARVKAKNGSGLYGVYSSTSDGVFTDATPPTDFTLSLLNMQLRSDTSTYYTTSTTTISASWTESHDPESGIHHYNVAVGVSSDEQEDSILNWTIIGSSVTKSTTTECLSLQNGNTYYYKVGAVNGAPLQWFLTQ